jgi:hypothetical protein
MFRPNVFCTIHHGAGRDEYGQPVPSDPKPYKCLVVRLVSDVKKTNIRTDASASRGRADEVTNNAILLFRFQDDVKIDDKVEIMGFTLRVISVQPRLSVFGKPEHLEVKLEVWA